MIADGVHQGYAEVRTLMAGKRLRGRPWAPRVSRPGLSGKALDTWVRAMAAKHPGQVKVH